MFDAGAKDLKEIIEIFSSDGLHTSLSRHGQSLISTLLLIRVGAGQCGLDLGQ